MRVTRGENRRGEGFRMDRANEEERMDNENNGLKVFKFKNDLWEETAQLSNENIAVVVDQTKEQIYFWQGKRARPKVLELAKKNLLTKRTQYSTYQYYQNNEEFPLVVQRALTQRMDKA